jgi:hypothetical protein
MSKYSTSNSNGGTQQAISATYKTMLSLTAQTTGITRGKLFHFAVGTVGTPANNSMEYDISRQTAAGTSTSTTPNPIDPADAAAGTIGSGNFTAEGTITATSSVFYLPVNQQATFQWICKEGCELIWPATNLAGLAFRARSAAYTGTVGVTLHHQE